MFLRYGVPAQERHNIMCNGVRASRSRHSTQFHKNDVMTRERI
ncbi:hypothetical protein HMPREF3231_01839 [Bifidobacterium longum]|nr:hypothetical protein HMPREF3231_01839 [Bifidobacterium longum]